MAREAALERLGILQEFGFEDNAVIYSCADNNSPINEAHIKIVDASVNPPALTSYPEYPISEFLRLRPLTLTLRWLTSR